LRCEEIMNSTTSEAIAQWMLDRIEQQDRLYQSDAASEIAQRFGREFGHRNRNGRARCAGTCGEAEGGVCGGTGGDARKDPFLAGEPARRPERVVVGDGNHLIDHCLVEHLRDEPDSDTWHLVLSGRAAGQDGGTIEVGPPLPHLTMTTS
jgi:hypothetical protein